MLFPVIIYFFKVNKHQNDVIDVVLLILLLTLNVFHAYF